MSYSGCEKLKPQSNSDTSKAAVEFSLRSLFLRALSIMFFATAIILALFSERTIAAPVVLWQENFDNVTAFSSTRIFNTNQNIYNFGSEWAAPSSISLSTNTTLNAGNSTKSLRGIIEKPLGPGGGALWGSINIASANTLSVYIEFDAKMPTAKHGIKFVKIFGASNGGSYANTTFGLDYTGTNYGGMYQVSYGDGTDVGNDTGNVIHLSGYSPASIGRSYQHGAVVQTPQNTDWFASNWGTTWHHFRIYLKFNSGTTAQNEVNDGEYYVEIDGLVYVWATGIYNRHYSNIPYINSVDFFGWSQTADDNSSFGASNTFELWYDNMVISTDGFVSGPKLLGETPIKNTNPPTNFRIH